ncbi:MAG: hypothetical protein IT473_00490 [Lysobacter sp.]|nr:hypothetical protein [Lysobacter sp.]
MPSAPTRPRLVVVAALSLAFAGAFALAAHAQQGSPPPGGPPHGREMGKGGHRGPPSAERVAKELGLDAAQTKSLQALFDKHRARMQQSHERVREEHEAMRREHDAELRKLLGDKKFEQFKAKREEHGPQRGRRPPPGGPRGEGGAPPPPR